MGRRLEEMKSDPDEIWKFLVAAAAGVPIEHDWNAKTQTLTLTTKIACDVQFVNRVPTVFCLVTPENQ